jgi:hypothetical protein
MLSLKQSEKEFESQALSSSARGNGWIRLRSTARSPYGTLLNFGNAESPPAEEPADEPELQKDESPEYTVKVGQQIFRSNDPKTLVKLAVAARRSHS